MHIGLGGRLSAEGNVLSGSPAERVFGWALLYAPRKGAGCGMCGGLFTVHSNSDCSGLIIHFMDSLALCLSFFLRDF